MRSNRQKQIIIDRQILALHKAMVEKVISRPQLFEVLQDNLKRYQKMNILSYGSALLWEGILATYVEPLMFREMVLSKEQRITHLRRRTIFSGILTEAEREDVLTKYIASELS
ncbi:hypothetical protein [Alteromonas sp. ASW11-130]|uniref:hypothetical protein n=1 Tax=Alteromonas sp. ASW11-130 TaxID=3015775 RepID=UPI0022424AC5|nr:hypothetical protein [Alteromonas sp. ASW11-130]MCW8091374.1 hypothetical protein [Alteromonas sp. ASW11-130]